MPHDYVTPKNKQERAIVERFKIEVCRRAQEIDPDSEHEWFSLSLGFFLASGLDPERAHFLSTYVRYRMGYWQ